MLNSETMSLTGAAESVNSTVIYLTTKEHKKQTNQQLTKQIENMLSSQKDFELDIQTAAMDMSALGGSGISIQVKERNLDTLQEIAKEVAKVLKTVEGTEEVSDGLEDTTGEIRILVDPKKADNGNRTRDHFEKVSKIRRF